MIKEQIKTDDFRTYKGLHKEFDRYSVICHSQKKYVREAIHTNTIENYFSILKRGLTGIYQHVSARYLKIYVGEFDFRYNYRKSTDHEPSIIALQGINGKRLLYWDSLAM